MNNKSHTQLLKNTILNIPSRNMQSSNILLKTVTRASLNFLAKYSHYGYAVHTGNNNPKPHKLTNNPLIRKKNKRHNEKHVQKFQEDAKCTEKACPILCETSGKFVAIVHYTCGTPQTTQRSVVMASQTQDYNGNNTVQNAIVYYNHKPHKTPEIPNNTQFVINPTVNNRLITMKTHTFNSLNLNIISILLALIYILFIFWHRIFRIRLPRILDSNYTTFNLIIFICLFMSCSLIFVYSFYKLLFHNKQKNGRLKNYIKNILETRFSTYIINAPKQLYEFLYQYITICSLIETIGIKFWNMDPYKYSKPILFTLYFICIFVCLIVILDIMCFKQFNYFYKSLILLLTPLYELDAKYIKHVDIFCYGLYTLGWGYMLYLWYFNKDIPLTTIELSLFFCFYNLNKNIVNKDAFCSKKEYCKTTNCASDKQETTPIVVELNGTLTHKIPYKFLIIMKLLLRKW